MGGEEGWNSSIFYSVLGTIKMVLLIYSGRSGFIVMIWACNWFQSLSGKDIRPDISDCPQPEHLG